MTNRVWIVLAIVVNLCQGGEGQTKSDTVPFVGCPADGQTGYVPAPQGSPKVVVLDHALGRALAYYRSDQAPGVFAPRGWYCRAWYGSSGSMVLVSPTPIDSTQFFPPKSRGPAVELEVSVAGTSGRFNVAAYGSRLFPDVLGKFVQSVMGEGLVPDSEFSLTKFAQDSVSRSGKWVAEFVTPAGSRGLGTAQLLDPSENPIRGVAVIHPDPEEPDMTIFRVRLGPSLLHLERALLDVNRRCMQQDGGC